MKITFGLWLDGGEPGTAAALAEKRFGPTGFLRWLEGRLGLVRRDWPSSAERVTAYEQALAKSAPGSFYETSFAKDPLAVAETLLAWRDELVLAGWNRDVVSCGASRPDQLFALESVVPPEVRTGEGDRLCAVLAVLSERPLAFESLVVVDDRSHIPGLWRRLLAKLGASWSGTGAHTGVAAPAGTDLAQVQSVLATGCRELSLKGDGSFVIYTAHSELTLGRIAGQELTRAKKAGNAACLLAEGPASAVDGGLAALDAPTVGLVEISRARAIPQVLALALRLRWQPLDPQHLLEFLTHPVCPVMNWLRRELADAVRETPGMGGPKWLQAVADANGKIEEHFAADAKERDKQLERLAEDLQQWIEIERFNLDASAPGASLSTTCIQVAEWAGAVAAYHKDKPDAGLYAALCSAAKRLAVLLNARPSVTQAVLDRLLGQVLGGGWVAGEAAAALGAPNHIRHPGSVTEPTDVMLWWGAAESNPQRGAPWTAAELEKLARAGIKPLGARQLQERETRAWERMVLSTRQRLMLFVAQQHGGETDARHPCLNRLQGLLGKTPLPVIDADEHLREAQPPAGISFFRPPKLNLLPLRRWWRLPDGCQLPEREMESFSSAEKFLYSPYQWVLRYPAHLRRGALGGHQLHSAPRLNGNLLHRLTEWLFNEPPPKGLDWRQATQVTVQNWVRSHWQRLLETEGASLLVPGHRTENARLRSEAERSLWELLRCLHAARIVKATANLNPTAQAFYGGKIGGSLDLVVTNQAGRQAVIDLKYGGREEKQTQLDEGNPLQLAVYGYLLSEAGRQEWPASAFFVLKDSELLTRDGFFSAGTGGAEPGGLSLEKCWIEFKQMWEWRQKHLKDGWIEITVHGTEKTSGSKEPDSAPPLKHWKPGKDQDKYNDFPALTGFGPHQ